jgi:hypothetical protein
MKAENTAAVIGSRAFIAVDYAGVSADCHQFDSPRFGGGAVSTLGRQPGHISGEARIRRQAGDTARDGATWLDRELVSSQRTTLAAEEFSQDVKVV